MLENVLTKKLKIMKKIKKSLIVLTLLFTLLLVSSFSDQNDNDIPFIGSDTTCGPSYAIEPGSCYINCTTSYYIFWIRVQSSTEYGISC